MFEHEYSSDIGRRDASAGRAQPDWATKAIQAKATEWSSDRVLDPGDSHDKGEESLCVGEAA
jgi:hypothetical protein